MAGMICRQPNGRLCRFSTIIDTVTHYNMTDEDYMQNVTGTTQGRIDAKDTIDNWIRPFNEIFDRWTNACDTKENFDRIVIEMKTETETESKYKINDASIWKGKE